MRLPKKKFSEFANFRNGVNFLVADKGVTAKIVGVGDFQNRTEISIFEELTEIRLRATLSPDDELKDGDLLFVRSNGNKNLIGRCVVIKNPPEGTTFSGFTIRARVDKSIALPEYVALIFQGSAFKRQISLSGGGNGNISNLNQALLSSMTIGLPSLDIQRSIVNTGAIWDSAIEKTERLIAAKKKRFQAFRESLLGCLHTKSLLHHQLEKCHFGDIFHQSREVASFPEDMEVLSVTRGGIVKQSEYFNKDVASEDKSKYLLVRRGQLVMSGLNFWMGSIDFQTICDEGIVSPAYKVFTPIERGVVIDYLRHFVRSKEMRKTLLRSSVQGASIVRRNLDMDELNASIIWLPNIERQQQIADVLNSMEGELLIIRQSLDLLRKQKRGLMQKLLAGQWRVKVPESEAAQP